MKKPNFFIIGAPKCGTTSLASWLGTHPNIYMSEVKEPAYFNFDINCMYRDSFEDYEGYFRAAGPQHIAIGEASTVYLRSVCAVPEILKYSPSAKFIVCIRNPIDMAISWHGQMCYEGRETERDFEKAWRFQEQRSRGFNIPNLCPDSSHLMYGSVCSVGTQVTRLLQHVDAGRVLFILLDDMKVDPQHAYQSALEFLGVNDDGRAYFPVLNEARFVPGWVSYLTWHIGRFKRKTKIYGGLGLITKLNRVMGRKGKSPIRANFDKELREYFVPEIEKIEAVLNRDLKSWYAGSK